MNKRKILMMAMALCMVAILAVGGSLAYFTAEDGKDNVFTMGGVDVDLEENFPDNPPELKPGLDIGKEVWAVNTGDSDAYVRVHIAIPSNMDDGNPNFNAVNNFLHFNFNADDFAEGLWSWKNAYTEGAGYEAGMKDWNFYTVTVDEVEYNVYVATYRPALKPGERTTGYAMTNVYLDPSVEAVVNKDENGNIVSYTYTDSHDHNITLTPEQAKNIKIKVWVEATQTDPFTNAYDALNAAFGTPADGYNPWVQE